MKIEVRKHKRNLGRKETTVRKHSRSLANPSYKPKQRTPLSRSKGKRMSIDQMEKRLNKLSPYTDIDGDGVINKKDCHPLDSKRQDEGVRTYLDIYGQWIAEVDGKKVGANFETEDEAREFANWWKRTNKKKEVVTTEIIRDIERESGKDIGEIPLSKIEKDLYKRIEKSAEMIDSFDQDGHFAILTKNEDGNWESEVDGAIPLSDAYEDKLDAEIAARLYIEENKDKLDEYVEAGKYLEKVTEEELDKLREEFGDEPEDILDYEAKDAIKEYRRKK